MWRLSDDTPDEMADEGSEPSEITDEDDAADRKVALRIIYWPTLLGAVSLLLWSLSIPEWLSVFASAVFVAGPCFMTGALLGLLFGVPRGPRFRGGVGTKLENTNLVQISDWLTKALVGAGLTQFHRVPDLLAGFGKLYEPDLRSAGVAIGVLIYFTVDGFFTGWLVTRIFVEGMLHRLHRKTYGADVPQSHLNRPTRAKLKRTSKAQQRNSLPEAKQ